MKWIVKSGSLVDDQIIQWEVNADSEEEAENKGIALARRSKVADTGNVWVIPGEEDMQLICNKLLEVFHLTRSLYDIYDLEYDPVTEKVRAYYESGGWKVANVAGDSGIALIKDIIRQIS